MPKRTIAGPEIGAIGHAVNSVNGLKVNGLKVNGLKVNGLMVNGYQFTIKNNPSS